MANYFDQFDEPAAPAEKANFFDQFDEPKYVPTPEDAGEIKAYEPSFLDRTRRAIAPLSDLIAKLSTPPPAMPQIPAIPSAEGRAPVKLWGTEVPASGVATAVGNAGIGLANSIPTPVGAALTVGGAPAKVVGSLMAPVMAQHAADQFQPMVDILQSPDANAEQKAGAVIQEGLYGLGTVAPLAGLRGPARGQFTDLGTVTPEVVGEPVAPKGRLALPEPTTKSRAASEVEARMAAAPDAAGKLAILKQEMQMRGDTLSKADQRTALDAKLQLEAQVEAEKSAADKQQQLVDIVDEQKAAEEKVLKEQEKQVKEAEQLRKQQDKAYAEQQKALEAPAPLETKPIVLANEAAQAAKAMENNPESMQATLNAATAPAQPATPIQLPEPVAAQPKLLEPAPATFVGTQEGSGDIPSFKLYNLTENIPGHPAGSTVSQATLEAAGYKVPEEVKGRPAEATRKAARMRQTRGAITVPGEAAKPELYHVTFTDKVPSIQKGGIKPLQTSNWRQGSKTGARYGSGGIYSFSNVHDALRWALKMDWEFNKEMGSGKISIVKVHDAADWTPEHVDPLSQAGAKGDWLVRRAGVNPKDIGDSVSVTSDMVRSTRGDVTPEMIFGEKGGKQTDTPAFKAWFGDSKVVDAEGQPLALYHGTNRDIGPVFKPGKEGGALGNGIYFTPNPETASLYTGMSSAPGNEVGSNISKVFVSLKKPFVIESKPGEDPMVIAFVKLGMDRDKAIKFVEKQYEEKGYIYNQLRNRITKEGYDGIMQNRDGKLMEVVAFKPEQVKSATGNKGTFDPRNPDIRATVETDFLSGSAGSAAGAGAGYFGTTKRDDETEEEFQARRLKNMLLLGAGGFGAGYGGAKMFGGGRASAASVLPVSSKVAKRLGIIQEHAPIADEVSATALRIERLKNRFMRGTPMRQPFFRAIQEAQDRIAADLDTTVAVLNDMRRKVVTGDYKYGGRYAGLTKEGLYQSIDEAFRDTSQIDGLPENLRDDAWKIFRIREENATRLQALEGLTDATKETILENGGNYLARQYTIFNLKNEIELDAYKKSLPPEDIEAALDAIQENWKPRPKSREEQALAASMIDTVAKDKTAAVEVIKSLRPWLTDNDAVKVAAWVAAGKQPGNKPVRALYMEILNPSDVSRDEAKVLLNQFLDRNQFGPFTMGKKQIGGKDVTSLYQRQQIDPRLRKVLGEIKDPLSNAYHSVKNQVQLLQRDREQKEIIQLGEAMGIMSRDPDSLAKGYVPFVEAGTGLNQSYDNWNGVYIQPVFREEFMSMFGRDPSKTDLAGGVLLDTLKTATGLFKYMKIIPTTDSRAVNAIGAWANNLINGRGLVPTGKGYRDGIRAVMMGNGLLNPDGTVKSAEILALRKTLIEQGIMDESALGRDFMENLNNSLTGEKLAKIDEYIQKEISNPTSRKVALGARFVLSGREFAAGDDVARIAGFLSERADYRKAFPNLSEVEIDNLAGRAMRSTGVIYSEVPEALRKMSAYNVLQPFINFPYAWSRSIVNTSKLAYAEMAEGAETGNTVLTQKGAKRMTALMAMLAASSGYGLAYWLNHKNGITDEKEAAVRRLGPTYIENSPLVFDGPIKDGVATIVEESYLMPPAMFMGAIDQGIKEAKQNGGWAGLGRGARVLAEPYLGIAGDTVLGLGPVLSTLEQLRNNKDEWGQKIYNPTDPDKEAAVARFVAKKFSPAVWPKVVRIWKATHPELQASASGQVFSLQQEAERLFGKRATTINVKQVIPRKAADLYETFKLAGQLYGEALRDRTITPEGKTAAYDKMVTAQTSAFNDLVQLYQDGLTMGLQPQVIAQGMVQQGGVPKTVMNQIMHARLVPKMKERADVEIQKRQMQRDQYMGRPAAQQTPLAPVALPQPAPAQPNYFDQFDK